MTRAYIVTGLGYGDESKGSVTDYLARQASTLVVRHNGGPQAGHNVVTSDGKHHTFSQFGAGSLAGAKTFLSRFMLVNPLNMLLEAQHLMELGMPTVMPFVDENAIIVTPFHVAINRLLEQARGDKRHGSCGQGVGVTQQLALTRPEFTIKAKDLRADKLTARLEEVRRHLLDSAPWPAGEPNQQILADEDMAQYLAGRYLDWTLLANMVPSEYLATLAYGHEQLVFEGAQGVLLDQDHGFCLTPDTEVLTDQGWSNYQTIKAGETQVSCFDLTTGNYQFEAVQRVWRRNFEGDLVRLKTRGMDCLATPEHRVVMRNFLKVRGRPDEKSYRPGDWKFRPAADVPGQVQVPIGGAQAGTGISELTLEDLRIMGWVITDGCWHGYTRTKRSHVSILKIDQSLATVKRGVNISEEMRRVLSQIDETSCHKRPARANALANTGPSDSWYLGATLSGSLLRWLGQDIHRIPRVFLKKCSKEQLYALYQGLMEGDGTSDKHGWTKFYPGKNEELADEFQELCLRLGISTTKSWVPSLCQWHVSIADERLHHFLWKRPAERVHYSGEVWDITVPTGAFVVRRNGQVFVTGNSPYTTWSTCTHENALTLIREIDSGGGQTRRETQDESAAAGSNLGGGQATDEPQPRIAAPLDVTRLGVIRAVTTRHGPGPHPTEDADLTAAWDEPHNVTDQWQRGFRVGPLDLVAHRYAAVVCGGIDQVVVTHLDRSNRWKYCDSYETMDRIPLGRRGDLDNQKKLTKKLMEVSALLHDDVTENGLLEAVERELGAPVGIVSRGPTAEHKTILSKVSG